MTFRAADERQVITDGLIYLASAYTHEDEAVRESRYLAAMTARASLMSQGYLVYSPIVENHEMQKRFSLPCEFAHWKRYNEAMIRVCPNFAVLLIDGYKESVGVRAEVDFAERLGRTVYAVDFDERGNARIHAPEFV